MLRQRLRGPSIAAYYPRRVATIGDLKKLYKGFDEDMETWDEDEEDRLEHLALAKQRGKGAPKKKRSADGESRRNQIIIRKGRVANASICREQEDEREEEACSLRGGGSEILVKNTSSQGVQSVGVLELERGSWFMQHCALRG